MSFFKKLKDEWRELVGDDKKDDKRDEKKDQIVSQASHVPVAEQQRDFSSNGAAPQQTQNHQPQQYYQGPPHTYGNPAQGTSLPPGWTQQWDANSQRYYYIDPQTGQSQWDPPMPQHHSHAGPPPQGYGAPISNPAQSQLQALYGGAQTKEAEKKKSGKGGLIAAGVGGAAVGALGVAALSGYNSSDDERHATAPSGGYYYNSAPPTSNPVALEDNPNLSSSQRSSLEEAREDLQEAEAKARDSDASSSDFEELREAREEYAEEVEEAHSELED